MLLSIPSSEPAAKTPAPSTARRVGVSIMRHSTFVVAVIMKRDDGLLYPRATSSAHPFQFVDHARHHRQPALPKLRITGVEAERLEQFGIMLGAAGSQPRQITLRKAARGMFVDRVKRVHQAIAERIGVD